MCGGGKEEHKTLGGKEVSAEKLNINFRVREESKSLIKHQSNINQSGTPLASKNIPS